MRKILIAIIVVASACGCFKAPSYPEDYELPPATLLHTVKVGRQTSVDIFLTTIKGHEYLLLNGSYRSGVCHSASCHCFTKNGDIKE